MIFLRLVEGSKSLNDYALNDEDITIGSDPGNVICLNSTDVAPQHALIRSSTLGIEGIGGKTVQHNGADVQRATLENGDTLEFGPYSLTFYHSGSSNDDGTMDTRTWKVTGKGTPEKEAATSEPTWKYVRTIKT
jgi:pSer/pThr/pTyr-binding forkhead associated (FHA) protein